MPKLDSERVAKIWLWTLLAIYNLAALGLVVVAWPATLTMIIVELFISAIVAGAHLGWFEGFW